MRLATGTTLGSYEILGPLGAGGMGEVYKANDTRLDRTVAIKVLPAALAADPDFKARFEREAKSISALNHPNICTLFDVGSTGAPQGAGGSVVDYLVMEYLEGETLATRLERGALPLADALKIGTEIASALDKAHRQGIVHRDLKPGNIMLVKLGGARSDATQAKLLDFGLAKSGPAGAVSGAAPTALATSPRPPGQALTAQGTILGTFQYMAPEQIEGEEADARTDIFAFGAVLFEMLTGRRAFAGKSQAGLLGAILKEQPPPVSQMTPVASPALDHVVGVCLAKDPDARFQTAHDLLLQLRWIADGGSAAGVPAPVVAHRRNRERFAWIAAAVLGVALVGAATIIVLQRREAAPVVDPIQFTMGAPENSLFGGPTPQFAVSPDGRQVVFVASLRGALALWIRPFSTLVARPLPGTEWATHPFWSPDSRTIGFFSANKLKTVPAIGGPPAELCDAPSERGGTWNRDNVILFSPTLNGPLQRVTSAGGAPAPVTALAKGETSHRWATFLPDGRHFLYFVGTGDGTTGEIRTGSLDSKEGVAIAPSDSNGLYAAGHLLFARGGSLMAQSFDVNTRQTTADAVSVAEQVGVDDTAYGAFSVTTSNVLTYVSGSGRRTARPTWLDRAGTPLGTAGDIGAYYNIALSPDERRVAVGLLTGSPGNLDVWLIDLARAAAPSRFTFDPAADFGPVWSPDGSQIAFVSNRGGPANIFIRPANQSSPEKLALKSDTPNYVTDWSRDGRLLAYSDQATATGFDLWLLPLSGDTKPVLFLRTPYDEDNAAFSPDGRWIAYDSNESRRPEVYVRPFPAAGGSYMVSRDGGTLPMWRDDGKELFFLALDGTLTSASVSTAKDFEAGVPKALFPTGAVYSGTGTGNNHRQYAVAKDGNRFLVKVLEQRRSSSFITVVVNWLAAGQK
ncbi:MAG: protein kinase [Acidobacteriota bacterium]